MAMVWDPLIKEGQLTHKNAFLRASRAMLLRLGASLKRVKGAIIFENVPVPLIKQGQLSHKYAF